MTILQRAATFAVMTFSLAGLVMSTPGKATEIDRGAMGTAIMGSTALIDSTTQALFRVTPPAPAAIPVLPAAPAQADPVQPVDVPKPQPATFDSLDAAVAAQDTSSDDDARCLAGAVYFESKGEPLSGQLAVAQVIINRAKSGRFPTSVCSVVTQRGQFSFVHAGIIPSIDSSRAAYRTALAVAKVALRAAWDSPAPDALFFHARSVSASARMTKVAAIGNHIFYR
ncbi:cell wall hydrolase [Sphingomonas sp. GC_Shp_6]|uniref:cell wall hydrolase n=2 Tax=unclassified Sphingomonas TaxID=196159 RepID=UPI002269C950|nr:cell wall hydrolase [Sphingomonas sp. GC_Shp_6]